MRIIDIIHQKRSGQALSREEIEFFVNGYVAGDIPDYQISSLLMAIWFRGMDRREIVDGRREGSLYSPNRRGSCNQDRTQRDKDPQPGCSPHPSIIRPSLINHPEDSGKLLLLERFATASFRPAGASKDRIDCSVLP